MVFGSGGCVELHADSAGTDVLGAIHASVDSVGLHPCSLDTNVLGTIHESIDGFGLHACRLRATTSSAWLYMEAKKAATRHHRLRCSRRQ
jgi:hypothetical protein